MEYHDKWKDYEVSDGYSPNDKDAEIEDLKRHVKFAWAMAILLLICGLLS